VRLWATFGESGTGCAKAGRAGATKRSASWNIEGRDVFFMARK
jgi:hypothetical protein